MPNITTNEIKTKLNYLRTQYCRELSKIKESYKSGCGSDEIYTPTTYWFDSLNFLQSYVNIKKGSSSVSIVPDVEVLEFEDVNPEATASKRKRKKGLDSVENAPEDDILLQAKQLLEKVVQSSSTTNKYDEGLLLFLQENLCDITNKALKDELSEQIITLVMQYKRQQRLQDKNQAM